MQSEIIRLTAENRALAERNRALESAIADTRHMAEAMRLGLTPGESEIYRVLRSRECVTREALYTAIYAHRPDGGPDRKSLDVMVHKLRCKLAAHGKRLRTVHAWGWVLEEGGER